MKIELKNIHFSEQFSEETNAFTANLYINGVHAGYCKNNGQGGNTDITPANENGKALIGKAEKYCKSLPPKTYESAPGETFSLDMNLELFVDGLLYDYLKKKDIEKFNRKVEAAMHKGFVIGIPNQKCSLFAVIKFLTIEDMLKSPVGIEIITNRLRNNILPRLTDGNILMNTNIPEKILRDSGLTPEQYATPKVQQPENKNIEQARRNKRR